MWLWRREFCESEVILLKKRDLFALMLAGVAGTFLANLALNWLNGSDDYDPDEDDQDDELEAEGEAESELDEALDEAYGTGYDRGFADGCENDYQGDNPAARALQNEVDRLTEVIEEYEDGEDEDAYEDDDVEDNAGEGEGEDVDPKVEEEVDGGGTPEGEGTPEE